MSSTNNNNSNKNTINGDGGGDGGGDNDNKNRKTTTNTHHKLRSTSRLTRSNSSDSTDSNSTEALIREITGNEIVIHFSSPSSSPLNSSSSGDESSSSSGDEHLTPTEDEHQHDKDDSASDSVTRLTIDIPSVLTDLLHRPTTLSLLNYMSNEYGSENNGDSSNVILGTSDLIVSAFLGTERTKIEMGSIVLPFGSHLSQVILNTRSLTPHNDTVTITGLELEPKETEETSKQNDNTPVLNGVASILPKPRPWDFRQRGYTVLDHGIYEVNINLSLICTVPPKTLDYNVYVVVIESYDVVQQTSQPLRVMYFYSECNDSIKKVRKRQTLSLNHIFQTGSGAYDVRLGSVVRVTTYKNEGEVKGVGMFIQGGKQQGSYQIISNKAPISTLNVKRISSIVDHVEHSDQKESQQSTS